MVLSVFLSFASLRFVSVLSLFQFFSFSCIFIRVYSLRFADGLLFFFISLFLVFYSRLFAQIRGCFSCFPVFLLSCFLYLDSRRFV